MKLWPIVALLFVAACSGKSPTAPTPPPVANDPPPVAVVPPIIVIGTQPDPEPIAPPFPPNDPRFNMTFYRQFAHNAWDGRDVLQPLRRQPVAPRIYLRTIDDGGAAIDAVTLDLTAAALINVAGSLTGVFGLAGLERGTDTREGQRGWITVRWSQREEKFCGWGHVGGDLLVLAPRTPGCRCSGNPATIDQSTVKHELGHVLGFWHTDSRHDLMYFQNVGACDANPSPREVYHARIAYDRPIGSPAP